MYLKNLEIYGFKSFAQGTNLEFGRGITAIVGPNGCGKSNIADALKWVLGVQGPKALRSKRMEDVIFNGTRSRKGLSMCEASVTLASDEGEEMITSMGSFTEVSIGRRLFRSGESEYLINKTPCRLKDVLDIFLDLGVGTGTLSIIEQGRINRIIDANPIERRGIIEEAAGILKYKDRKEEALRKLAAAEQNLLRVDDILSELRTRLNSLKRQARKAERYRKLQVEARELELSIIARDHMELSKVAAAVEEGHRRASSQEAALSAEMASSEAALEAARLEALERGRALDELKRRLVELEHRIDKDESTVTHLERQAADLLRDEEKAKEEIGRLSAERDRLEGEIAAAGERSRSLKETIAKECSLLEAGRKRLEGDLSGLTEREAMIEEAKSDLLEAMSRISHARNGLSSLEVRLEDSSRKEALLTRQLEEEGARRGDLESELEELGERVSRLQEQKRRIQEERETLLQRKEELISSHNLLKEEISSVQERLSEARSSLRALEEMERDLSCFTEGPRSILLRKREEGAFSGITSSLAEIIETDARYEAAIESALGERLQSLILTRRADGMEVLRHLKGTGAGRVTLLPSGLKRMQPVSSPFNGDRRVIGRAADLVRCSHEHRHLVDYLLSEVYLVESMEEAEAIIEGDGSGEYTLVSLDGQLFYSNGIMAGGSTGKSSPLRNRRMASQLKGEVSSLEMEMGKLAHKRGELEEGIEGCISSEAELSEGMGEVERHLLLLGSSIEHGKEEMERLERKVELLLLERENLRAERQEVIRESESYRKVISEEERERDSIHERIDSLKRGLEELRASADGLRGDVKEKEVSVASLRVRLENAEEELHRLELDIQEKTERLSEREKEGEEIRRRLQAIGQEVNERKAAIGTASRERERVEDELHIRGEEIRGCEDRLKEMEAAIRLLSVRAKEVQGEVQSHAIRKAEVNVRIKELRERVEEEFHIAVEECGEELLDLSRDLQEARERLTRMKERLSSMGNVNLAAPDEYQEVNERYSFLNAQEEDIVESISSLKQAIDKINRTTTRKFLEALESVRTYFGEIFGRLFLGGEAEIRLLDEGDPLGSGIEIMVQPPGKRLRSINLLSEGEKALAAASLLFSVFKYKESPICLLDEVDAPLDEPNARRFMEIVRELCDRTQFIITTHNKATMAQADSLYGLTMEEDGITKVISLSFAERPLEEAAVQA